MSFSNSKEASGAGEEDMLQPRLQRLGATSMDAGRGRQMPVSHSSTVPSLTSTSTENRELGVEKTFDAFEMRQNEDLVVV